jgi:DnaJ family protein C protein 9
MHSIEESFGTGCDLYKDVLKCPRDADKAQLRKAYYRAALKHHPDRNPGNKAAHKQFQAISLAYQILSDPDSRQEYDETGVIPDEAPDEDDKAATTQGQDVWKQYFDQIFGKVTTSDIDAFASKYKCSDEERRDVLKEFKARKGNLLKMLEFVMLSEARDAKRWVEDYILPAMEEGKIDKKLKDTMEKTLKKCETQAAKENTENEEDADEDLSTETASEDDDEASPAKKTSKKNTKPKSPPRKAKPTQAKRKKKGNDMQDLVAQIQNRRGTGGSLFASIGARYGVDMDCDDPLDDSAFAAAQAKVNKQARRK